MAAVVTPDQIDFSAYLKETESRQKVRPAKLYVAEIIQSLRRGGQHEPGTAYLPWDKTHGLFHFRPGEVTLWAGPSGNGKSLVTGQVCLSLMAQGERTCVASFEMKPKRTLQRMGRQWGRENPNEDQWTEEDALRRLEDLYRQFGDWTDGKLWLYDQQGTTDADTVIAVARYCAKELRVTQIVIDSLMKCVRDEDDYNGQKAFVDELCAVAKDCNCHIHLVHHTKKLPSEETVPGKNDVKGSGSITDQVDNAFLVWRNKRKEADRQQGKPVSETEPDELLICCKQRNGECEPRISLWFDEKTQQFVEHPGLRGMPMWNWPHREME
jgi:twinkle protein